MTLVYFVGLYSKVMINRDSWGYSYSIVRGEILGFMEDAQGAPYSAIISAAGGEKIPKPWLDQLAVGGRLVAPVMNENGSQVLVVIDKLENGYKESFLEPVHFVPLRSGVA